MEHELNLWQSPLQWVVFKIHNASSNHSQNWFLPLVWILLISIFYTFLEISTTQYIDIDTLFNIIDNGFFNDIFNNLNPFSKIKENMTLGLLAYKITMAYLIYQFVISVRQNTRRK